MTLKKTISALIVLALALMLVACGGAISETNNYSSDYSGNFSSPQMMVESTGEGQASNGVTMPSDNRKIILNASIDMQTETFEDTCSALEKAVKDVGGYISSTSAYDLGTNSSRSANYEFRVPSEKYSQFISSISSSGTVTSKNETTDDITSQYVDVEARLKSLKLQEERLFDMMEKAEDVETLLAVQSQLSDVQYQIENYTSQQKTYDELISYATVNISVDEVNRVTEQPKTFVQRVGTAFSQSWYDFGEWCQDFAVGFVYALPALILLALIAFIIVRIALAIHNKNVTKRQQLASVTMPRAQGGASYSPLYAQNPTQTKNEMPKETETHDSGEEK